MKGLKLYLFVLLSSVVAVGMSAWGGELGETSAAVRGLAAARWKKRVLVDALVDPVSVAELEWALRANREGVDERDLIRIRADDPLRAALGVKRGENVVLLFGKDGGEKRRWTGVPDMSVVFSIIDAMPMRQREMQDR